jgi:hypothetical protein
MRVVSLVAISFLTLLPGRAASRLSGTWVLNSEKSDFGRSSLSGQIVVRTEQTGRRLTIWRITTDSHGQHLTRQEYNLDHKGAHSNVHSTPGGIALRINSTQGMRIDEEWHVTRAGELIITRVLTTSLKTVRQRLVLEPAVPVLE